MCEADRFRALLLGQELEGMCSQGKGVDLILQPPKMIIKNAKTLNVRIVHLEPGIQVYSSGYSSTHPQQATRSSEP